MAKSKTSDIPKGKNKKKLSRSTKFAILTACLLLAVCGYAAAVKLAVNASDEESEQEISFVDINEDDVVSISWEYDGETYTLTKTDEGTWVRADEEDFELEQDTVNSMVAAISNITASRRISGVTDFAQYGLTSPQSRITITYAAASAMESEAALSASSASETSTTSETSAASAASTTAATIAETSGTSTASFGTDSAAAGSTASTASPSSAATAATTTSSSSAASGTSGIVTIEILTGDLSDVSGEYYARIAGSDTVYMVYGEYLEYFECSADELAAAEEDDEDEE